MVIYINQDKARHINKRPKKYNILIIQQKGPRAPHKLEKQLKCTGQEELQTQWTYTSEDSKHAHKRPRKVEVQLFTGKEKRSNGLGEVICEGNSLSSLVIQHLSLEAYQTNLQKS